MRRTGRAGRLGIARGLGRVRATGREQGGRAEDLLLPVGPGKSLCFLAGILALISLDQSTIISIVAAGGHDIHVIVVVRGEVRAHERRVGRMHLRDANGVSRVQDQLGVVGGPFKESTPKRVSRSSRSA